MHGLCVGYIAREPFRLVLRIRSELGVLIFEMVGQIKTECTRAFNMPMCRIAMHASSLTHMFLISCQCFLIVCSSCFVIVLLKRQTISKYLHTCKRVCFCDVGFYRRVRNNVCTWRFSHGGGGLFNSVASFASSP